MKASVQSHPNAYLQGEHCCEINTDFDSLMTIISPALSFVSTTCKDAFGTNRHVACPHPPSLNFQYQPYWIYVEVSIGYMQQLYFIYTIIGLIDEQTKETQEDCLAFCRQKQKCTAFTWITDVQENEWSLRKKCYLKTGEVTFGKKSEDIKVSEIPPCP